MKETSKKSAVFAGRFENLANISSFVKTAAENAGLDEKEVYAVQLAVDEAVSNIIEHSYGGEGVGNIQCACEIMPKGLCVTLEDTGTAFNPDDVPDLDIDVPLMERQPRGAGVFLIKKLMDLVKFAYTSEGKNILKLYKWKK